MGDGNEPNEPNGQRFCEVIRLGIEDNTAEVIIFYTPDRDFQVFHGYVIANKDETIFGRRYRKLTLVTSKANVVHMRRYHDTKEYVVDNAMFYFDGQKVKL
ncbi:uncharacterized protein LOC141893119 [Acropora palmata]|uniref:uncharacterized protein LOC141893119 n=1 Tax=Acropora palmata TaxID=6131 RepID=UPI003DA097B2